MNKLLSSPIVKTALTFLAFTIALNIFRPQLRKLPVVGQYL